MTRISKFSLLLVPLFLVAACNEEQPRTVEYYLQNKTELEQKLAECRNDPGKARLLNNCVNAEEANRQLEFSTDNTGMPSMRFDRR